jgi:hypothetical protein
MKVKVTIINYTTMSVKEIEKYHQEQCQILLDMINAGCYSQNSIDFQKKTCDEAYRQLGIKLKQVSKIKGA